MDIFSYEDYKGGKIDPLRRIYVCDCRGYSAREVGAVRNRIRIIAENRILEETFLEEGRGNSAFLVEAGLFSQSKKLVAVFFPDKLSSHVMLFGYEKMAEVSDLSDEIVANLRSTAEKDGEKYRVIIISPDELLDEYLEGIEVTEDEAREITKKAGSLLDDINLNL